MMTSIYQPIRCIHARVYIHVDIISEFRQLALLSFKLNYRKSKITLK